MQLCCAAVRAVVKWSSVWYDMLYAVVQWTVDSVDTVDTVDTVMQ